VDVVTVADTVHVRLLEPVRGIATGQAVVLYDGDTVLGAATVAATAGVDLAEAGTHAP
jgi:tRNA-uridine 2-sulfurtransferase